jgi:DNA-binding MarR family transcriptional regulator
MHRSNITGLVDRLELRGLVQRKDSATDRRAFNVLLTAAGGKLIGQIRPHYYRAAEAVWQDMPVTRTRQLVAELETISRAAGEIAQQTTR